MRSRVALAAAMVAAALAAGSGPASAACSVAKFRIPVEMQGLSPTVLAKVNGRDVRFLLDSGAFFSGIGAKFAFEQKMKPVKEPSRNASRIPENIQTGFVGVGGGERISAVVQADKLEFAGVDFGRVIFMTMPLGDGGLLGQNFLRGADVEYDFKNGTVFLVTPTDCKTTTMAYWSTGPYSVLPLESDENHHTVATVLVNGRKMRAVFDTGASVTFITRRAAARAGVKLTDPEVKPAGPSMGLDGPLNTWAARFASVQLDGEGIQNGRLRIGDTDVNSFDMLIGADFFLSHHVYVANSQGKIYFTHNGGPVFSPGSESEAAAPPAGAVGK
jgi:predicted aspartyl protease